MQDFIDTIPVDRKPDLDPARGVCVAIPAALVAWAIIAAVAVVIKLW